MKQWVLNNRRAFLLTIAIYQLIGGAAGLLTIILMAIAKGDFSFWFFGSPVIALILISFFAGIVYFFKGESIKFFLLSKLNFCAQLFQLALGGVKFLFFYGFYFSVGADEAGKFLYYAGIKKVEFAVGVGQVDYHFFLLNFFPLIPLIILRWAERNPAKSLADTFLKEEEPAQ